MSELLDFRSIHNKAFVTKKQLVQENITFRKQLKELENTTYCAYCGERFALDDKAATFVTKHIHTCSDHPMRAIEAERDALRKKLEIAVEALKLIAEPKSDMWFQYNYDAQKALAEIEKIGGENE